MAVTRIRATSGDLAGKWLWMIGVTKGGLSLRSPDWHGILTGPSSDLQFYPKFIDDKFGGFRPISPDIGKAIIIILKNLGIEAELVTEEVETPS